MNGLVIKKRINNRWRMDNYMYYTLQSSKVYVDNSEFGYTPSGVVQNKRTIIHSPTGTCAVWQDSAYVQTLYAVHTDYLGSWVAITNSAATVTNRYSYDAWGRARNVNNWELKPVSITNALTNLNAFQPRFDRGYTGHEHLSGFGLIHMNARVYDPYLQRFLSPDNYIQDMANAQNYNRYSY
ncbi:MAG TPA: RHS repeat-associated core domain-containing protein, partial [Bacteroidales bacterium]|nr:RHS repeat-associated core domain-containing protein [Bacteroidales bacterium]